jgi:hypothetical protein
MSEPFDGCGETNEESYIPPHIPLREGAAPNTSAVTEQLVEEYAASAAVLGVCDETSLSTWNEEPLGDE